MWLTTPTRLTNVEFMIPRTAGKVTQSGIDVLNENDNLRSHDELTTSAAVWRMTP
jgi:hypothetical protein